MQLSSALCLTAPDSMSAGLHLTLKHRQCVPAVKLWVLLKPSWRCLQDMVIPAFKPPAHVASSPLLGGPVLERTHLLFFRGDVGLHRLPNYSRGIRWGHMPTDQEPSWHCSCRTETAIEATSRALHGLALKSRPQLVCAHNPHLWGHVHHLHLGAAHLCSSCQ